VSHKVRTRSKHEKIKVNLGKEGKPLWSPDQRGGENHGRASWSSDRDRLLRSTEGREWKKLRTFKTTTSRKGGLAFKDPYEAAQEKIRPLPEEDNLERKKEISQKLKKIEREVSVMVTSEGLSKTEVLFTSSSFARHP